MMNDELWTLWQEDDALDTYNDEQELTALEIEEYFKQVIKQNND